MPLEGNIHFLLSQRVFIQFQRLYPQNFRNSGLNKPKIDFGLF